MASRKRKRGRRRGLGSPETVHTTNGRAAYRRLIDAAHSTIQLARDGDCQGAFAAYGQMERAYGEAFAHARSGGAVLSPVGDTLHAERALARHCLLRGRPKLARGSEPPPFKSRTPTLRR